MKRNTESMMLEWKLDNMIKGYPLKPYQWCKKNFKRFGYSKTDAMYRTFNARLKLPEPRATRKVIFQWAEPLSKKQKKAGVMTSITKTPRRDAFLKRHGFKK